MDIGVEISLYPLKADYIAQVHAFIDRLSTAKQLRLVTNSMSTQVFGGFEEVMDALRDALGASLTGMAAGAERAVFVLKVIGPLPGA
ncbi:MAG TPA: YkoF family thiamine/hydroxymethylpyrimidine-binding protein [Steroidobacteraceae bacterium]|nr:YkoF family thiamine/hydroxymethylpyrimidine-binding protein [Steroidobacteraceae bacterium]